MQEFNVIWMAVPDLLNAMDPENGREHDLDGDVKETAHSLLTAGWVEIGIAFNEQTKKLVGGHGRVLASDWLRKQDPEYFERQWEIWLTAPDRKAIAKDHHERFNPAYWGRAPVVLIKLDEHTHRAMLVRLNNQSVTGRDNPSKVAALLAKLPKQGGDELAGWDSTAKKSYVSAFLQRQPDPEPEVQAKQYFARPDATDHSGDPDDGPDDAVDESGEVSSYRDPSAATWEDPDDAWGDEEESPVIRGGDGAVYQAATVSTDNIADVKPDIFQHSAGHYSETSFRLYISNEELIETKTLLKDLSVVLGIDTISDVAKVWRSKTYLAALRWCLQHHPDRHKAEEAKQTTEETGDEDQ